MKSPLKRSKAATIKDVGERAGVSYQTVSRVVNGSPHVKVETRARVTAAMEALGYRPNVAARHLASRRSRIIGFIGSALYYGPVQVMLSVEQTARKHGYHVMVAELGKASAEELRKSFEELCARQVDGIVLLLPLELNLDFLWNAQDQVPFVVIDLDLGPKVPKVLVDQKEGSLLAVHHILSLGHRRIALISGPSGWRAARARTEWWLYALENAGLVPGPICEGDWTPKSGYEAAERLIREHRGRFTAIIVANDHMALGVLSALRDHGIRVPEEVSVIGYDGLPESEYYQPALTTVYQNFATLGEVGVEFLLNKIERPKSAAKRYLLKPRLVPGKSTAIAPALPPG